MSEEQQSDQTDEEVLDDLEPEEGVEEVTGGRRRILGDSSDPCEGGELYLK
jgi:hypothetical protein